MTKMIESAGKYEVEIREPHWEDATKDTMPGMALVLPGYVTIGGEEYGITGRLYFTSTIIGGGQNQGRPLYEVSAETCERIGMTAPFSPEKKDELDGKRAVFVVEEEEYKGVTRLRVAFVNPAGKESIEDDKARAIWNAMSGGAVTATPPTREAKPDTDSDDEGDDFDALPF